MIWRRLTLERLEADDIRANRRGLGTSVIARVVRAKENDAWEICARRRPLEVARWRKIVGLLLLQVPIPSSVRNLMKQGNGGRTPVLGGTAAPPLLLRRLTPPFVDLSLPCFDSSLPSLFSAD